MDKSEEKKIPEIIDYLTCRNALNEIGFSDDEIRKALQDLEMSKKDLCDEKAFEHGKPYHRVYEYIRRGIGHFKKYQSEYIKEYTANADIYLVPAQYQGLRHGKIIRQLLNNRYDWFDTFLKDKSYKESETGEYFNSIGWLDVNSLPDKYKEMTVNQIIELSKEKNLVKKESAWSLYEMYGSKDYEIYLTTSKGSLYVPIKALIDKDWFLIEQRMKSYAISYHDPINLSGFALNHRGRTKEEYKKDKEADYNNTIAPLESPEALKLKEHLKS